MELVVFGITSAIYGVLIVLAYRKGLEKGMYVGGKYMAASIMEQLNEEHDSCLEKQKAKSGSK